MKKILTVFGTRPEAIKMCPLIKELKKRDGVEVCVCVTAQHREMLDSVLEYFDVVPDFDLGIMKNGQTLFDLTEKAMRGTERVLDLFAPHITLVHGDTTSAFAAALAAFYKKIPIGHVEAGLRTHDMHAPFPEEFNRKTLGAIAALHFAPTQKARENLLREGVLDETVFVTGNTVSDALNETIRADFDHPILQNSRSCRLLMLTVHRRENAGAPMTQIFRAVRRICADFPDVKFFFPIHKNPEIRRLAERELGNCEKIFICEPLPPFECHNLMSRCYAILTDSGGIQEEASAMGKPTLVLRSQTERPEGVEAGILRLAGTSESSVYAECARLLRDTASYQKAAHAPNPYGNGGASKTIADILCAAK